MIDGGTAERSSLIQKDTTKNKWIRRLKNRYSKSLVTSRRAILCLVWLGTGIGLRDFVAWFSWITLLPSDAKTSPVFEFIIICSYFFWPLLGYVGDRYTRYNVIITGVVVSCLTTVVLLIMMLLKIYGGFSNEQVSISVTVICLFINNIGIGFVVANIIQFTTDQDPQASSEELASYARWWVFAVSFTSNAIFSISLLIKTCTNDKGTMGIISMLLSFVLCVAYGLFGVCFKRYFIIEPPPTVDPLKLMYRVLKYAWKHKYPERRSAFTYSDDPPSRLDYGKDRYGGPFTTDQVESVKSFWYILPVILCIGVSAYQLEDLHVSTNFFNSTSDYFYSPFQTQFKSDFLLTLVPPFFQLILIPLFPCLIPSMLKQIWFSISLIALSSIVATVVYIDYTVASRNGTEHVYALIIFNVFVASGSIGAAITAFSSLEFILAQAPVTFQGLLIGIWSICVDGKGLTFLVFFANNHLLCYSIATSVQCVSLIVFSIIVYHYKYRLRNELSDINRRQIVEEIYERNLSYRSIEINSDDTKNFSVVSLM